MYGLLITIVAKDYTQSPSVMGITGFDIQFKSPIERDMLKVKLQAQYDQLTYDVITTEYKV